MQELGLITGDGDGRSIRFERRLGQRPERVWSALTDPGQLGAWLTRARVEPRRGGEIVFDFGPDNVIRGRITIWDPPRALAYGWRFPDGHDSRVSWTLAEDGDGTTLTLVHELLPARTAPGYGAGWHAFLDRLAGHLGGEMPDFEPRFEELRPRYEQATA